MWPKTPYDDGTTHVVLSPLEFIGRLAALVPRRRVNLTRFHGVFSLKHLGLDSAASAQIRAPPAALFDHSPNLF